MKYENDRDNCNNWSAAELVGMMGIRVVIHMTGLTVKNSFSREILHNVFAIALSRDPDAKPFLKGMTSMTAIIRTPQVFSAIDEAKWERVKAALKAKTGVDITTNVGEEKKKGLDISWDYTPATQSATVMLNSRSFYDPSADVIMADIAQLVANA